MLCSVGVMLAWLEACLLLPICGPELQVTNIVLGGIDWGARAVMVRRRSKLCFLVVRTRGGCGWMRPFAATRSSSDNEKHAHPRPQHGSKEVMTKVDRPKKEKDSESVLTSFWRARERST